MEHLKTINQIKAMTQAEFQNVLKAYTDKNWHTENVVFIAMSIADYELMSYNMQEIKRYVQQMQDVVVYYRRVVEDNNEKVEK